MTSDLDVLAGYAERDDLTEAELVIGLALLSGIAQRVPYLPRPQQVNVGGICIAYCLHVAELVPPARAAVYRNAAELIRQRTTGWHD